MMHTKLFLIVPATATTILVMLITLMTFTIPTFAQSEANQTLQDASQSANQTGEAIQGNASQLGEKVSGEAQQLGENIPTNIISLIYCSHQIFYNIQVESCSPVIITNIVF